MSQQIVVAVNALSKELTLPSVLPFTPGAAYIMGLLGRSKEVVIQSIDPIMNTIVADNASFVVIGDTISQP